MFINYAAKVINFQSYLNYDNKIYLNYFLSLSPQKYVFIL